MGEPPFLIGLLLSSQVCALQSDLRILEDGDMLEIGERRVSFPVFHTRVI